MVNRILLYTVNTGAIIACVFNALLCVFLLNAAPSTGSLHSPLYSWCAVLPVGQTRSLTSFPTSQFAFDKNSLAFLGLVEIQAKREWRKYAAQLRLPLTLSVVYANSFLGSLNARAHMRDARIKGVTTYSSNSTDLNFTSVRRAS